MHRVCGAMLLSPDGVPSIRTFCAALLCLLYTRVVQANTRGGQQLPRVHGSLYAGAYKYFSASSQRNCLCVSRRKRYGDDGHLNELYMEGTIFTIRCRYAGAHGDTQVDVPLGVGALYPLPTRANTEAMYILCSVSSAWESVSIRCLAAVPVPLHIRGSR